MTETVPTDAQQKHEDSVHAGMFMGAGSICIIVGIGQASVAGIILGIIFCGFGVWAAVESTQRRADGVGCTHD